jgi:AcrR family transcriptional regulator
MPPKVKTTKKDILAAALSLVREQGEAALGSRNLAAALGCSTQPIFSNFESMEDLQHAVMQEAYEHYLGFLKAEAESEKYPEYKAFGMAYIRFAKEEKELFKFLFMCDRHGQDLSPTSDFETSVEILMSSCGVTRETAQRMHLEMWACVHGIATMLATSFLELDQALISDMISDVYQGLRAKHVKEN